MDCVYVSAYDCFSGKVIPIHYYKIIAVTQLNNAVMQLNNACHAIDLTLSTLSLYLINHAHLGLYKKNIDKNNSFFFNLSHLKFHITLLII